MSSPVKGDVSISLSPFPHHSLRPGIRDDDPAFKMRKYSKLLLIVITLVSLVCFVFYKTQYDKLYNVLQVLEFFGDGTNGDILGKGNVRIQAKQGTDRYKIRAIDLVGRTLMKY